LHGRVPTVDETLFNNDRLVSLVEFHCPLFRGKQEGRDVFAQLRQRLWLGCPIWSEEPVHYLAVRSEFVARAIGLEVESIFGFAVSADALGRPLDVLLTPMVPTSLGSPCGVQLAVKRKDTVAGGADPPVAADAEIWLLVSLRAQISIRVLDHGSVVAVEVEYVDATTNVSLIQTDLVSSAFIVGHNGGRLSGTPEIEHAAVHFRHR
jgi:hypothetical protein